MKTLFGLLALYAAYAAVMVWLHPRFIYPFQSDETVLPGFSRVEVGVAEDGIRLSVQERRADGPIVLYFMGNAGALPLFESAFDRHIAAGRHVIAMEYRGGGGRPGQPSERQLKADAIQVAQYALDQDKTIVIQGYSLGTGLALHVAARRDFAGVILTAPYDRICRLMASASYLPACWLPVQRWSSIDDIGSVSAPILVLHGSEDSIIPPRYSKAFETTAKRRVIIPGAAHSDIGSFPLFGDEIEMFFSDLTGS